MTDTSHRATGSAVVDGIAAAGEAVLAAPGAIWDRAVRRLRAWQTERALLVLSDSTLKDIGLSRSEIRSIAHGTGPGKRMRRHAAE